MKNIIFSVIFISALAIVSCTKKMEDTQASHLAKNTVFSPEISVATAD